MSKLCPTCKQTFEDAYKLCPFDGAELSTGSEEPRPPSVAPPTVQIQKPALAEAVVAGRYRIHDLIGEDDFGVLFHADDVQLKTLVELRLLPEVETGDARARERLMTAARLSQRLRGPHVQRTLDVVLSDDQRIFLVREALQGRNLRAILAEHGALPQGNALRIISEVGRALEEAHGLRLVHGDLSPQRVTLVSLRSGDSKRTLTKVSDFGVIPRTRLPAEGVLPEGLGPRGSPGYISPEAIRGEVAGERGDVYALGAMLYEMLTGRAPHGGRSTRETLRAQLAEDPPPMKEVSPALVVDPAIEALAIQALSASPQRRPVSARAFVDALAAALGRGAAPPRGQQAPGPPGDRGDMPTRTMTPSGRAGSPPPGAPRVTPPPPGAPRVATPPPAVPRLATPSPGSAHRATPAPGGPRDARGLGVPGRRFTPAPPAPHESTPIMPASGIPRPKNEALVSQAPLSAPPRATPPPVAANQALIDDDDFFVSHDSPRATPAPRAQVTPESPGGAAGAPWIDSSDAGVPGQLVEGDRSEPVHSFESLELAGDETSALGDGAGEEPLEASELRDYDRGDRSGPGPARDAGRAPAKPAPGATKSPGEPARGASTSAPRTAAKDQGFSLEQPKAIAGIPVEHLPWFGMALLILTVFGFLAVRYADDRSGDTRGMIVRIPEGDEGTNVEVNGVAALIAVGKQIDLDRVSPRIHIDSRPTGAIVSRDGVGLGRTPLWLRIPVGRDNVELLLQRAGYLDQKLIIDRDGAAKYLLGLDPLPVN